MPSGMDGRPDESWNWVEGAWVCRRLLRRDQGSLPLLSLGSGQRRGGRSVPGDGGASCRSGLGSEKGPAQSAFSGTPGGDVERCPLRVRTETTPCPAIHWDPPKDR